MWYKIRQHNLNQFGIHVRLWSLPKFEHLFISLVSSHKCSDSWNCRVLSSFDTSRPNFIQCVFYSYLSHMLNFIQICIKIKICWYSIIHCENITCFIFADEDDSWVWENKNWKEQRATNAINNHNFISNGFVSVKLLTRLSWQP